MNSQEYEALQSLLVQFMQIRRVKKDPEADAFIQATVVQQPDATYLLEQRALLLGVELDRVRARVALHVSEVQRGRSDYVDSGAAREPLTAPNAGSSLAMAFGVSTTATTRSFLAKSSRCGYVKRKGWPLQRVQLNLSHGKVHAEDSANRERPDSPINRVDVEIKSRSRKRSRRRTAREIRVNAVTPGPIDTPILGKVFANKDAVAQVKEHMLGIIPMKRFGKSGEIAKAVLFLAFDATFTNGHELPVDGGWSQL
jgi:hypothetical protein